MNSLNEIEPKQVRDALQKWVGEKTAQKKGLGESKRKIKKTIREILGNQHPTEKERVSLVMQLHEINKFHNWGAKEICDYVHVHNKWLDYDPKVTEKKIFDYISKYFIKTNPNKKETTLNLKSLNYFFNLKKDKRFIVENFLHPKTITMIFSPPHAFKSLLVLWMSICIVNGKPFLENKTKKYPVIYCDKENNEQILRERILGLHAGQKLIKRNSPLKLLVRDGDILNPTFQAVLKKTVKEQNVKLVVFDTLHRFADYEENKADDLNRLYVEVFQPLVDETDCSVVFLHHTTKEGRYRGSSDLLGMVDVAFSIVRPNNKSGRFKIINEKNRSGEIDEISGEIDFGPEQDFYITIKRLPAEIEKEETKQKITKKKEVTNAIRAMFEHVNQTLARQDIMDKFEHLQETEKKKYSLDTIKRALKYLVINDQLKTDGKGNYTRLWEGIGGWQ